LKNEQESASGVGWKRWKRWIEWSEL